MYWRQWSCRGWWAAEQARVTAAKSDIVSIGTALDMYEMDNGKFPATLDDLLAKTGNGPYLKKPAIDPWGRPYTFEVVSGDTGNTSSDYKLCSQGPDETKKDDDICNQ